MQVKWAAFDEEVPKPYLEPDKVVGAVPRPHDGHGRPGEGATASTSTTPTGASPLDIDPMYQRLTVQAQHADPDFYARFYPPGALTEQHLRHFDALAPGARGPRRRPASALTPPRVRR